MTNRPKKLEIRQDHFSEYEVERYRKKYGKSVRWSDEGLDIIISGEGRLWDRNECSVKNEE